MPTVDTRPTGVDFRLLRGAAKTIRFRYPTSRAGRTYTLTIEGVDTPLDGTVSTTDVAFVVSAETIAAMPGHAGWTLTDTTDADQVQLVGQFHPSRDGSPAPDDETITVVTTDEITVNVDILGEPGPKGDPGDPGDGGGVTDHGDLTGLEDDDHPQYLTDERGDARYDALGAADVAVADHVADVDPHADRAYTDTQITALKNGAPAGGDTLAELDARLALIEAIGSLATDAELIAAVAALIGSADTAGDTLGELEALITARLAKANNLSDLANVSTALTNLGFSTFVKTLLSAADAPTLRTALGLTIGTDVQAHDADLDTLAAGGAGATALLAALLNGTYVEQTALDTDGTLAANSDSKVATQKATKTYVDAAVTGLLDFKGSTDASASPNYPVASKGDAYVISVAGKIGGASGKSVDIGDVVLATADNAGGTEASVGTSWTVLEHNLVGALLAANNLSDVASASTARTNLGLGNVDNTSDANKPVSTAQQTALDGKANALTRTAVKTSAYTAAAGDLVPVDTTSGAVTVTLPSAPADRTRIGVKHIIQGSTNAVTVARGGTDVFNKAGGSTSLTLSLVNQGVVLEYNASGGIWTVVADDLPLSGLDGRFIRFGSNNVGALVAGTYGLEMIDTPSSQEILVHIDHQATASQCYGLDIRNRDGARSALVIHQYSALEPAVWIDNTDTQPAIKVNNTSNAVFNPDGVAQGDFITFNDAGTTKLRLNYQYTFVAPTSTTVTFLNTGGGKGLDVQNNGASVCFHVLKSGTGAETAVDLDNRGTGRGLLLRNNTTNKFALDVNGIPEWLNGGSNEQTTVGAAGAASALPATPTTYLKVKNNAGTTLVVPAYAAS